MWTNYEIATGLDKKEGKTRTATFLTCIGADALEISLDLCLRTKVKQMI